MTNDKWDIFEIAEPLFQSWLTLKHAAEIIDDEVAEEIFDDESEAEIIDDEFAEKIIDKDIRNCVFEEEIRNPNNPNSDP